MSEIVVDGVRYQLDHKKKTATAIGVENKHIKAITIPSTLKLHKRTYKVSAIGERAFANCTKLEKVVIGKNVSVINDNAFSGCKKLKEVSGGEKLKTIGTGAFQKCISLTTFTIPATVKEIGKNAFNGCKKLKTISFKGTVINKIGKNAFNAIKSNNGTNNSV